MYTVKLLVKPVADAVDALSKLNLRNLPPEKHCLEKDRGGPAQVYNVASLRSPMEGQCRSKCYCSFSAACSLLKESMHH